MFLWLMTLIKDLLRLPALCQIRIGSVGEGGGGGRGSSLELRKLIATPSN